MTPRPRMSPVTALFLALGGMGVSVITAGTVISLYAMSVISNKASGVLALAEDAVTGLPEFLDRLPPALSDMLHDRRAPDYASNVEVKVAFTMDDRHDRVIPALRITNKGDQVISLLGVRVTALNKFDVPVQEWTEVAATPIMIEDEDWRGPLMPHATRHVVLSSWKSLPPEMLDNVNGAVEISELRVWEPRPRENNPTPQADSLATAAP